MRALALLLVATAALGQPSPGDLAPDPEVEMFVGAPTLASWSGLAGRAVVMDLWATWCAPCVATLPHMAAVADSLAGRPVQFLSVTDEPYESVEAFLATRQLAGWVGFDEDGSSRRAYGVTGIPAVVLVWPDGRLAAVTHPDEVTVAVVEALMAGEPVEVRPSLVGNSLMEAMRRARETRPAVADGPRTFSARWGAEGEHGSARWNVEEGWVESRGSDLTALLAMAWVAHHPFREGPTPHEQRRHVDVPDSLGRRGVHVELKDSTLTRATIGGHLIARLESALGVTVRFENRPAVVYVLRQHPERALTLTPSGAPFGASSRGAVFTARAETTADLARALGSSLGHSVIDETGLDGAWTVTLEMDPDVVDFDSSVMTAEGVDGVRAALLEATGLELVPEVRPVVWMVVRAARAGS